MDRVHRAGQTRDIRALRTPSLKRSAASLKRRAGLRRRHAGGRVFPREWDRFVELLPEAERGGDLAAAYARLLASPDQAVREEAARRWCEWKDTHMSLAPGYEPHLSVQELSWQMVVVDDAGHFGGSMGERFTAAIDAMAGQLHPA